MSTVATLTITLSLGLAVLYALVILVWYELLRSLMRRRRARKVSTPAPSHKSPAAEPGERESSAGGHGAAMESELMRVRRHYQLSREEAMTERDAAVAAAHHAADQAIERIEGRYREIDGEFLDEETERILEMLRPRPNEEGP